ncbi:MAG TPA: tetraacyldisaccharide 4'-kinase [Acidiferrobacterales bacterium]|nr:tetraacyldisaccharide 4'-kinase [Acidiferrobacterales bacterium]
MSTLERHWYRLTPVSVLLIPLSLVFCALVQLRRVLYRAGVLRRTRLPVPVIVVGNITVGGTGKTPLVIWLADVLRQAGYHPGIVTRGYRGNSQTWPVAVTPQTPAAQVGDEAVLLARHGGCPVLAGPDRVAAAKRHVVQGCNVIISDDGLQHYRLHRDLEIAVIDGTRRFGNRLCLPAGPLREPVSRLRSVFVRVANGTPETGELGMTLEPTGFYNLAEPERRASADEFRDSAVHAVAGIGNPERFFASLRGLGLNVIPHPFPDHHDFRPGELEFSDDRPLIMTEKDAVKCQPFANTRCWVLAIEARPDVALGEQILQRLKEIIRGQEAA